METSHTKLVFSSSLNGRGEEEHGGLDFSVVSSNRRSMNHHSLSMTTKTKMMEEGKKI